MGRAGAALGMTHKRQGEAPAAGKPTLVKRIRPQPGEGAASAGRARGRCGGNPPALLEVSGVTISVRPFKTYIKTSGVVWCRESLKNFESSGVVWCRERLP
jgi:hypothetical protein